MCNPEIEEELQHESLTYCVLRVGGIATWTLAGIILPLVVAAQLPIYPWNDTISSSVVTGFGASLIWC